MKIRKISIFLLLFLITLSSFSYAFSNDEKAENLDINSRSAIVLDRNTKKVLYGKCENEIRKMASTTKIMTAIIVIENANLYDTVTISKKAANTGGSTRVLNTYYVNNYNKPLKNGYFFVKFF